jgi:predicted nucleic acid-binding protein
MPYLLDTNVLSELRKGLRADGAVLQWAEERRREAHYVSVLSLGEVRRGIEMLRGKALARRAELEEWLGRLLEEYADSILGVSVEVADRWGRLGAKRSIPVVDGLLAATAFEHGLTLATRNGKDFLGMGVKVENPFGKVPRV